MNRHSGLRIAGRLLVCLLLAATLVSAAGTGAANPVDPRVTAPRDFFGYDIGEDGKLTPWQTRELGNQGMRKGIVEYAYELQRTSNRVRVFEYGKTEMGRPMILTVITAPNNWAQDGQVQGDPAQAG